MSHFLAWGSLMLVAAISLGLAVIGANAWRRTQDRRLLLVAAAFFTFFVKNAVSSVALLTDFIGHETLEVVGGLFDLVVVGLLVAPLLAK